MKCLISPNTFLAADHPVLSIRFKLAGIYKAKYDTWCVNGTHMHECTRYNYHYTLAYLYHDHLVQHKKSPCTCSYWFVPWVKTINARKGGCILGKLMHELCTQLIASYLYNYLKILDYIIYYMHVCLVFCHEKMGSFFHPSMP